MRKLLIITIALLISQLVVEAQGTYYGLKGGLSIGSQKWNSFERDLLFRYHGALCVESTYEDANYGLYGQIGYHIRGSAIRIHSFTTNQGIVFNPPVQEFLFRNISLGIGVKQKFENSSSFVPYYLLGLRAEYTIGTNFNDFDDINLLSFYPNDIYLNKFNYGLTFGGGFDLAHSEFVKSFIEITFHPDVSKQYDQFETIHNVLNPRNPDGPRINLNPQSIRNFSIEVSAGIKFLQKIEYYD